MIQLKNVERSYKTAAGQTWVLRRINLEIREGEFVTIMGPSGAGKSSLLNVLALLDDQWRGEYWFRQQAVHDLKRKQRGEERPVSQPAFRRPAATCRHRTRRNPQAIASACR